MGGAQYGGGVQYRWGYHDKCGDILSTVGMFSTVGISWVPWGVILSTVGVQYRGGYHDAHGDIMSTVGDIMSTVGGVQYSGILK